ncbi:MAG: hypothetical protein ACOZCF_07955 [Bacillota bacterium]
MCSAPGPQPGGKHIPISTTTSRQVRFKGLPVLELQGQEHLLGARPDLLLDGRYQPPHRPLTTTVPVLLHQAYVDAAGGVPLLLVTHPLVIFNDPRTMGSMTSATGLGLGSRRV